MPISFMKTPGDSMAKMQFSPSGRSPSIASQVLTDFQIPSVSLAGDSAMYKFPLEGETATPEAGLNPSEAYTRVSAEWLGGVGGVDDG